MGRDEWYHAEGGAKASAEAMLATAAKVSEARAARARAEAAAARRTVAPVDAWRTLAATLLAGAGESVLGALQRLGRRARPPVVAAAGTAKRSRRGAPAGLDDGGDTVEGAAVTQEQKEKEHALARDQIEALTAAAGALMESSDIDEKVYELTFEHACVLTVWTTCPSTSECPILAACYASLTIFFSPCSFHSCISLSFFPFFS